MMSNLPISRAGGYHLQAGAQNEGSCHRLNKVPTAQKGDTRAGNGLNLIKHPVKPPWDRCTLQLFSLPFRRRWLQ